MSLFWSCWYLFSLLSFFIKEIFFVVFVTYHYPIWSCSIVSLSVFTGSILSHPICQNHIHTGEHDNFPLYFGVLINTCRVFSLAILNCGLDFKLTYWPVPDDTVHMGTNIPSFGTQVRLILDVAISPYSIYLFIYFFSLFYSIGEPAAGDNPGGAAATSNGL